jgi:hypothetical protein
MTVSNCCTQHLGTLSPPLHQVQAGWGDEGDPRLSCVSQLSCLACGMLDLSMHDCCTLALVSICTLVASAACPGHVDARAGVGAGQGRRVGAR